MVWQKMNKNGLMRLMLGPLFCQLLCIGLKISRSMPLWDGNMSFCYERFGSARYS